MQLVEAVYKLDACDGALIPFADTYCIFCIWILVASFVAILALAFSAADPLGVFECRATALRADSVSSEIRHDYGPHGIHQAAPVDNSGFAAFSTACLLTLLRTTLIRVIVDYWSVSWPGTVAVLHGSWPNLIDSLFILVGAVGFGRNLQI